jgi:hypothetical protein
MSSVKKDGLKKSKKKNQLQRSERKATRQQLKAERRKSQSGGGNQGGGNQAGAGGGGMPGSKKKKKKVRRSLKRNVHHLQNGEQGEQYEETQQVGRKKPKHSHYLSESDGLALYRPVSSSPKPLLPHVHRYFIDLSEEISKFTQIYQVQEHEKQKLKQVVERVDAVGKHLWGTSTEVKNIYITKIYALLYESIIIF